MLPTFYQLETDVKPQSLSLSISFMYNVTMEETMNTSRKIGAWALSFLIIAAATATARTPQVKNYPNATQVAVPERMITYLEALGVDMTGAETNALSPQAVRQINEIYYDTDEDWHAEINGIAAGATARARAESGEPSYLEVGDLYWGAWYDDDPTDEDD